MITPLAMSNSRLSEPVTPRHMAWRRMSRGCRAIGRLAMLCVASSILWSATAAAREPNYPLAGRYGLAAHKQGRSLEDAKAVLDSPAKECADGGRWFEFNGNTRLDHFTGNVLTFKLRQSKFTPPNTYYLIEGESVGDAFVLHKIDDKTIDLVLTNGSDLFIQLWMVKCDSLPAGAQ
jgi:hypothetical protein